MRCSSAKPAKHEISNSGGRFQAKRPKDFRAYWRVTYSAQILRQGHCRVHALRAVVGRCRARRRLRFSPALAGTPANPYRVRLQRWASLPAALLPSVDTPIASIF